MKSCLAITKLHFDFIQYLYNNLLHFFVQILLKGIPKLYFFYPLGFADASNLIRLTFFLT